MSMKVQIDVYGIVGVFKNGCYSRCVQKSSRRTSSRGLDIQKVVGLMLEHVKR